MNIAEGPVTRVNGKTISKMVTGSRLGQVLIYFLIVDNAKYEGTYSNGKKNGRGILHFADGSKYIGEF